MTPVNPSTLWRAVPVVAVVFAFAVFALAGKLPSSGLLGVGLPSPASMIDRISATSITVTATVRTSVP